MEAESISQRFAGLFPTVGSGGGRYPGTGAPEEGGGGISCLLKCDGIVSAVKITSITPFSLSARRRRRLIHGNRVYLPHKSTYSDHFGTV